LHCLDCGKVIHHSQKGFTWTEDQRCPQCFMQHYNLKKVKINRTGKKFVLVYIEKSVRVLSD